MAMDQFKVVVESIRQKINLMPSSPSSFIKVPEYIRLIKKECYEPLVVSIGPIYYKKTTLENSQEIKLRDFIFFLDLISQFNYGLQEWYNIAKGMEDITRAYYQNKVDLSSNEFIEMLMIDAAFIISLFIFFSQKIPCQNYEIRNKLGVFAKLNRDLFLVENQLPFFVLNDLYDTVFRAFYPEVSFLDLTFSYIDEEFGSSSKKSLGEELAGKKIEEEINVEHLVDFLRIYYLPSKLREIGKDYNTTEQIKYPTTAKELKAAGVKFMVSEGDDNKLDITYSKGKLKIPKLFIQDTTEAIFRNIIFFEQSHYRQNSYFIDYMTFFDDLIDSPEDVQILVKNKIMEHWLGTDDEVANVINSIVKHISIHSRNFYYNDVCHKLNDFASKKRNKWKAILRRNYFNHPWSITSVIYLVILLILTILQVYIGFKS